VTATKTRYFVRNERGEELLVPSLEDLYALYSQGFLADGDQVRQERSEQWIEVARFPALRGVREARREPPARFWTIVLALLVLALAIGILVAHHG
jgi:hypothetical protein